MTEEGKYYVVRYPNGEEKKVGRLLMERAQPRAPRQTYRVRRMIVRYPDGSGTATTPPPSPSSIPGR